MTFFAKNKSMRTLIALLLLCSVLFTGGCVTIQAGEAPTEESTDASTQEADSTEETPTTQEAVTEVPTTQEEPTTEEDDLSVDWENIEVESDDPNILTDEDFQKLVEANPQMTDLMELIGPYVDLFGFAYDVEQDIFYSTLYPIQRIFGFNSLYDTFASRFGMFYQTKRIRFDYEGKEWMVQLWKGQYGVTVGSEVGIYYRDADSSLKHYEAVADEDMIMMGFQLCKNNIPYLERGPEKHWWLTGFKILDFAVSTQLSMIIYFDWESQEMADAFEEGLQDIFISDIVYLRNGTEFWLSWTL